MRHEEQKSADDARFDLFADVAHELQTPIAIVAGNLEMVEHGDERERKKAIKVIRSTIAGMSRLTNGLLQTARLRGAYEELCKERIDTRQLLNETYEDCLILAVNGGINLSVDAEEVFIEGDRRKLKEVLFNLISNALRHTETGGSIRLRAHRASRATQEEKYAAAQISIEDTGSGIAEENLAHVFERFYRIERPGSPGTGLGLYLCRQIIEAHTGTIIAESEPGKGSVFTIFLPAVSSASPTEPRVA